MYTMTPSSEQYDPGLQVVVGDVDPEVDGRGLIHGSQPDRNALPEDLEAHFQATFQPDEPAIFNATFVDHEQLKSQREPVSPRSYGAWFNFKIKSTGLGQMTRKIIRSRITFVVISALLITCATLAGIFGKRRSDLHNYR